MEEQLAGGVANAGAVVRIGPHVFRPSNPHSPTIHRFLTALRDAGFEGASAPVGIDPDGRERLVFIEGDVPVPPFPAWAQANAALGSVAELIRRFHDASRSFDPGGLIWSPEMADPTGGPLVCHNDVCLENVVFRDGVAVRLLDFDFAAPGRPVYDLVQFARMCVPVDDPVSAAGVGWRPADLPARLRLVADTYGLDGSSRRELLRILGESIQRAASSSATGSRPATRTSSPCGTRWAARNASTVAAAGGPGTGTSSSGPCTDRFCCAYAGSDRRSDGRVIPVVSELRCRVPRRCRGVRRLWGGAVRLTGPAC